MCIRDRFYNGLAAIQLNNKWGYINKKGEVVVPPVYDRCYPFSEGLGRVQKGKKWGYLDPNGEAVIEPTFDNAYDFHDGLARVIHRKKKGFIRYIPPKPKEDTADKPDAKPEELTSRTIKKGQHIKINNPKITIKIYDYKKIDGDIISLNYKGNWLVKDFLLSQKPHEIKIDLEPNSDKNYLMLYAKNLGRNPPNTAAITIIDGEEKKEVVLESDLTTCDIIYFDF